MPSDGPTRQSRSITGRSPLDSVTPSASADVRAASTALQGRSVRALGWRTVFASSFGLAIGPSCLTILAFGAFIAPLDREFGWGVPKIALGASIISLMIMILSPLQGVLVDRYGGRRVVLWSIPFFALSLCALYELPNNLAIFYLAWVLVPICGIGVWPISYLRATTGWFDKHLGLALGVTNAGIGVGTMLVPLLSAYLIGSYGWREAYLCLGLLAFAAWPVAFFFMQDPAPATTGIAVNGDTLTEARRTRPFWVAVVGFFFLGLFTTSLIIHQVRILIDAGIAPSVATAIPAAFGAALIAGRLGTGWLLDRYPASRIMSVLMFGGAVAAVIYATGPSVAEGILCAVLLGAITGAEFDVLSYIIPRYFGRRAFGKIYGVIFAVFQLASAIGTFAIGASRGGFGSYGPAMLSLTLVCLIAALLFTRLGPYRYINGIKV